MNQQDRFINVHGDIRHLERLDVPAHQKDSVHGDIRHLERGAELTL